MKQITPFSISAPGFYGLNLSDSPVDLPATFALEANNCVIDKAGRVSSRKGWSKANSANTDLSTSNIECIGELIQVDGTATTLCAGGAFLFKLAGSTLTTLTYGGGGSAPTISAANWKFCQLNGIAMFWQRGYDPLIYDPAVSTTTFRRLSEKSGALGTIYQCHTALSAYGRVWAADNPSDKGTVVWSDLLTPHIWTGGTAGSLNLTGVWPMGGDEIVALAAHNSFLYIFGRKQILVYQGADTPTTMSLYDTIVGVGCIARDSVQTVGEDVIFLSDMGVMSLARTIQEKSAPFRPISKNVHRVLQEEVTAETLANVKSGFSAVNAFYLLTVPTAQKTYCFDIKNPLQDGSAKTTVWSGTTSKSFFETKGRKFYMGKAGYLGEYTGYLDDTATYRMTYYTSWIDFGNPIQRSILKKIFLTAIGGATQSVIFKWAYDFIDTYYSETVAVSSVGVAAQFNVSEYGIGEFTSGTAVNTLSANGSSAGKVLQFGFETNINNTEFSVQKIDLFTKDGRL